MHTPGPWTRDHGVIRDGHGTQIALVAWDIEDDARLIAAAPRLLEALTLLYLGVSTGRPLISLGSEIAAKARAAIAEAKGK